MIDARPRTSERRAWMPMLPAIAAVVAFVAIAILAVAFPGRWSTPPSPQQCADDWNASQNAGLRSRIAQQGYEVATVDGWVAQRVFGHCEIRFSRASGGSWTGYVRWVYGYEDYHDDTPPWYLDRQGTDRIPDRTSNAHVGVAGTIVLRA